MGKNHASQYANFGSLREVTPLLHLIPSYVVWKIMKILPMKQK